MCVFDMKAAEYLGGVLETEGAEYNDWFKLGLGREPVEYLGVSWARRLLSTWGCVGDGRR